MVGHFGCDLRDRAEGSLGPVRGSEGEALVGARVQGAKVDCCVWKPPASVTQLNTGQANKPVRTGHNPHDSRQLYNENDTFLKSLLMRQWLLIVLL